MSFVRRGCMSLVLFVTCVTSASAARGEDPRSIPLVDQRGAPFRLADLRGRPTFVTFVASRCTDTCPIANAEFAMLARRFARGGERANLVTVTLDPAYDRPFVMAGVAARFGADARFWRLASGRPADLRRLMRAFGIVTQLDRSGVPDVHSTFVFLLDRNVRHARTLLLSTAFPHDAAAALASLAQRRYALNKMKEPEE